MPARILSSVLLPRAVAADDAEELAGRDLEVDVAQRVLDLDAARPRNEVQEVPLERALPQVGQQEVLGDAAHLDRREPPLRPPRRTSGDRRRKKTTDVTHEHDDDADRDQSRPRRAEHLRDRHRLVGDQAVARVLDDLGHRVQEQQASAHGCGDHAQRIDDRRRVERRLQHDLPDVAEVAIAHEQRAEEEGQRHRERDQLDEQERQPQEVEGERHARDAMKSTITIMLSAEGDERRGADATARRRSAGS